MTKLVYKNLSGYKLITILGPFFKMLEAIIELFIPLVVAQIIDVGIKNNDNPYIFKMCALMLSLYIVGFLFSIICQYFASVCAFGFGANLRNKLFKRINDLSLDKIEGFGVSTLTMRVNTDCNNVQTALNRFIRLVTRSPFILIGALIMAIRISKRLSLIFFGASILIALSLFLILKLSTPKIKNVNKFSDNLTQKTRETLSGARPIKAFNKQTYENQQFNNISNNLNRESITLGAIGALTNPLTYLFVNLSAILIIHFGSNLVYIGTNKTGQIIALINYLSQILNSLVIIASLVVIFSKASASSKRITQILNTPIEPNENQTINENTNININENEKCVEFKNVNYGILKDISFTLNKNETLGIIGGTGSGKTTLISLIARLYPFNGQINIFNKDINTYELNYLRNLISILDQKNALLLGTIRDNLKVSNPLATDTQMNEALNNANCTFVRSLDALVTRGGTNFSGGQKQRLSLARAIIKPAKLLIIDDGLSALDYNTEQQIYQNLNKLNLTKIIVSQRINSIKNSNLILVLEQGKIVGLGNHQQLINSCKLYQEIALIQEGNYEV